LKVIFFLLLFVVPSIMLYSSEISPTRCNNCVFIFIILPNGRVRLIQLPHGVLVLVSQFRLLGVDEFNICGSEHHAL